MLTTDAFGSDVYSYDVGVDVPSEYYAAVGGASSSLEMIEYSLNNTRAVYLHQVGVLQMLGRVVLRADSATDPYAGSSQITNTLKTAQGQWWPDGGAHADARVAQTIVPVSTDVGGVAFMSEFVHAANVAVSGSFTRGSRIGAFDVIGRHEMAHNWDLDDEHGGNPEGPTIESGNAYARFDLTELATLATTRAIGIEEGLMRPRPAWSAVALPPTGVADLAQVAASAASTAIDVLANDHSVTGSPLRVTSAGASGLSDRGQAVSVGADGVVRYTPSSVAGVTDHFTYRVTDAAGRGATVNVFVRSTASQDPVVPGLVDPVVPGSGDPVVPGSGSVDPVVSGSGSTDPVDSGSTDPVVAGALDQVDIVRDDTAGLGSAGAKAEAIASTDHVATGRDTLATTGRSLRPVLATTAAAIAIMLSGVLALLLSLRRQAQRGRQ